MEANNKTLILLITAILPAPVLWAINGLYIDTLVNVGNYIFWVHDAVSFVILPFLSFLLLTRTFKIPLSELGLAKENHVTEIKPLVIQVLIAFIILWYVYRFAQYLGVSLFGNTPSEYSYPNLLPESGLLRLLGVIYFSITAGLAEEFIFRAAPWAIAKKYLQEKLQAPVYIIITSIVFSSIHWENGADELFATFVFGIVASYFYLRIGWLWPLVIGHFLTDFIEFI